MGSFGPNPMLTESPSATTLALPPLILIHDSSGVVYSYLRLKALHRAVYAIHDPGFFDEKACAQSVRELAATYWGLVRQGVPRGEIILGGKYTRTRLREIPIWNQERTHVFFLGVPRCLFCFGATFYSRESL